MAKQKVIARFGKTYTGTFGGLIRQTLLVYELKTCYKAEVWNSHFTGWHGKRYKPVQSAKFYAKDGDMDLYRCCEYFGFKLSDRL